MAVSAATTAAKSNTRQSVSMESSIEPWLVLSEATRSRPSGLRKCDTQCRARQRQQTARSAIGAAIVHAMAPSAMRNGHLPADACAGAREH